MAAANESQGLKIAVAVFVTLAVVLAVTTYFGFSNYSQSEAKLAKAESEKQGLTAEFGKATTLIDFLKGRAGYAKAANEDPKALQDDLEGMMKKDDQLLADKLNATNTALNQLIQRYRTAGGNNDKIAELTQFGSQLVAQINNEPNKTYQSSIDRMMTLVDDMAKLSGELTLDNEDLRSGLASTDATNAKQLQVQIDELKKAKDDLMAEHDNHEMERQSLLKKNDELNSTNSQQATEIARLNQQIAQINEDNDKARTNMLAQLKFYRAEVEKKADVMDVADGLITYVDYARGEVMTNLTRSMGARERMHFSIFDRNAPGLPSDKPKAVIELTRVTDSGSIARIVETMKTSDPIRFHDQVYSPAWSPNQPQLFALIGKIDVNRDGRDDRQDLIRMIEGAGGKVAFDLPPPPGKESGSLDGMIAWYVIDEQKPLRDSNVLEPPDDKNYLARKSEVLKEAHLNGVRPLSIERLLSQLGYKYGRPSPGQVEAINKDAVKLLLNPRGTQPNSTETPPTETPPQPATP